MRAPIAAAIFDMDGLLIDSEPIHFESLRVQLKKLGVTYEYSLHETLVGTTDVHCYEVIRAANPQLVMPTETLVDERHGIFLALVDRPLTPLPGVVETLDAFAAAGLPMAVASSSPAAHIERVLSNLGIRDRFVVTWSGCDVPRSKPHPDVYLAAADALGVAAESCVVFEDSGPGVAAGAAAGSVVFAVPQRETLGHNLAPAHAQLVSLEEFDLAALKRRWNNL
ncbi:MAG: sugar-phosphatase [Bradymonadia bacterium]